MNAIYLRRRLKVTLPDENGVGETPLRVITALQKNIASLGFVLDAEVCQRLEMLPVESVDAFYKGLVKALRQMVGDHREHRPMYPNFPEQVMEMSETQLYWNAIVHYCTNRLLPFAKRERVPLFEKSSPKVIELGSREDFEAMFTGLVSAATSISEEDKGDIGWFVTQYREGIVGLLPDEVPSRENLAVVGSQLIRETESGVAWLNDRIDTATDVLRLAVAMSDGGDVSLAEPTKFTKLKRKERRQFLAWIERSGNPTEDMLRWKERWKRLGELLHPGEYANRFPKTAAAFDVLRNERPFETFNSVIEQRIERRDIEGAVQHLSARPGELARRLDHLLRLAGDHAGKQATVVKAFRSLAEQVATAPLLQAMTHFRWRSQPTALRTFFPKGEVAKVQAIPNTLTALPEAVTSNIASICESALTDRFAKLTPLGRCYLDPRMSDFLVPFSQRSAAKALKTVARGSHMPLPDCKVFRFFIWWRNGRSRTDIDLSAALFNARLDYVDVVSYYNLKTFGGHHSGDIVNAPQGASEFIDLDVERTRSKGVRYIVMSINSYTSQPFCDLPECFAGWMARREPNSGEIYEPQTVENKVDIASDTRVCLPALFDLEEKKVVWMDIALKGGPYWNNVANNLSGVSLMVRAILSLRKTTLHDLFRMHIAARGTEVDNKEAADTVFAPDDGLTPFEIDRIAGEFL